MTIATNLRRCDSNVECLTIKDNSVAEISEKLATKDCVTNKANAIEIYTALKVSLDSGIDLYQNMMQDLEGTYDEVSWDTPG